MNRVLIVDDEFTARYAMRSALESAGYNVMEACDGVEALLVLETNAVDVVVLDIVMPRKEGVETTMEIHRDHPSVKIIAISGGGRNRKFDFLEMAQYLGAHSILKKPFTDDQLLEAVSKD